MHCETDPTTTGARLDPETPRRALQLHSFTFGDWTLRGSPRTLEHHGESVPLQPQALQVLEELLADIGNVVERDHLTARIFADRPFLDHRQAINRAVSQLRRVLGDSARKPQFIETVGSRGYRFIAPTTVESVPLARRADRQDRPENQAIFVRNRVWFAVSLAALILALFWLSAPSRLRLSGEPSLQFANWAIAEHPESGRARALAVTLARELSAEVFLAQPPGWSVLPEEGEPSRTADRRIEGSLRLQSKDRAVITIQLVDADGRLQWVRSDSVEFSRLDSWLKQSATELVEVLNLGRDSPI